MIELEEAWQLVQQQLKANDTESVSLENSAGRTLAVPVVSDVSSPPFDKSLVDGYAIASWNGPGVEYPVLETVTAGQMPQHEISGIQATRIMTGSPIPDGTVGVVMVEESEELSADRIRLTGARFVEGQNILRKATVIEAGQELLPAGGTLAAQHVGALAEFGWTSLQVFRRTKVSILATGDELVEPDQVPGPGQIRNSNGILLGELARYAGADVHPLGIGRDRKESLLEKIRLGLNSDILVIAGGVSAGVLDLIPQCLQECGVREVFHKINLKPGKPLWFGRDEQGTLVFGLPGNPVSSLVCFKLFVDPAIRNLAGSQTAGFATEPGILAGNFVAKGGRRTFWPVRISSQDGKNVVHPIPWKGSADQVAYLRADGLMDLGTQQGELSEGTLVPFLRF